LFIRCTDEYAPTWWFFSFGRPAYFRTIFCFSAASWTILVKTSGLSAEGSLGELKTPSQDSVVLVDLGWDGWGDDRFEWGGEVMIVSGGVICCFLNN
jgi:hypothetical protein